MRTRFALLFPVLLLGCDTDVPTQPLAPEDASTEALLLNVRTPIQGTHEHFCTGEILVYEGWAQERFNEFYDQAGGYHGQYSVNEHIKLENPLTGDEYIINFIWREVINERPDGSPMHYTFVINQSWVGKGPLVDRPYKLVQSVTTNANGDLTVDKFQLFYDCR